ncbi:MAG: 30S ribosomal protein S12 methylthiotransferase RimO [Deltaproteobacteria bacterium]|nr:30S ribosomal protein S12 methylthiotransferase RimO [Deltaproteobacteria bacterium]
MHEPNDSARVHFVTLGCPKNRVDSELMLGQLQDAAMRFTMDPAEADVIVVNTCGFIEDAKKESIDVILEMAKYKAEGLAKKLIVTGCLVQRYSQELHDEIPEIDALLGNGEYASVAQVAKDAVNELQKEGRLIQVASPAFIHQATSPRVNTFLPHSAYVKVSEGCDQKCTFCIIPALRGLQRSRTIDDVVMEAESLAARGVVELNLVAQDLTGYGTDLTPRKSLADLLRALAKVDVPWIRMHYAYPRPFSKALLSVMAEEPRIVPYLDMPLQHIADPVLKRMKRGRPRKFIEKLLEEIRVAVPHITLRTSFIVGFPGETDQDFQELCDYIEGESFDRVGVFKFSREEGTPSHDLDGQVPAEVIAERHAAVMELLREKSKEKLESFIGRRVPVLVDGPSEETDLLLAGRHSGQAPEIDGTTYINDGQARAGDLVEVEITETFDYDLVGHITQMIRPAPPRPDHARLEAVPMVAQSNTRKAALRVLPAG